MLFRSLLVKYGFERNCHGVHGTDIPVLALENLSNQAVQSLEAIALQAMKSDNSSAIVLGCAGMAHLCDRLSQSLGVPVIDGVASAVQLCEVQLDNSYAKLRTGGYEYPLPKTHIGWTQSLAP